MGKTVPSYRVALEHEIQRWSGFANALRPDIRTVFEELMDICRNYASAASCATRPVLFEAMVMTILLDQNKKLNQIEKKLQELSLPADINCISVSEHVYEKTKNAIEELNLPFTDVDDFVEEQMKRLHEQHDQWKEQMEETEEAEETDE